jgi:DNA-binding response OmpR family regulator
MSAIPSITKSSASVAHNSAVATRTAYVLADAEVWSQALSDALESLGLEVSACSELHQLFEMSRERSAQLLVIAQGNGAFAARACRVIRGLQDVPMMIVMPREGDLIPVLDAGADDAVVARVDPPVFAARVRALLRRARPASRSNGELIIRDLVLDLEKYQVTLGGSPVALTPTEFRLLAVLAQQAGRVVDPRALLSAVHHHDYGERDAQNLVKVHIANLRRKMNDSQPGNEYILCVRGFGYMLERRSLIREDDPLSSLIEA